VLRRTVSGVLIVLLSAAALPGTDAWPPRFQSDVDMVRLSVSVLNSRDRFVDGLVADDFVVLENGVQQKVTLFDPKDLPLSLVLLLDMSASMAPHRKAVIRAATRLVERLRPQDEAEVVSFSQRITVLEPRTTDHGALLEALERTHPEGTTALHNALYVTLKDLQHEDRGDNLRRRAVVLLSDGEDTSSAVTDEQVLELARTAQIGLYTILLSDRPRSEPSPARHLLDALAHESGGEAFLLDGVAELHGVYERIAQELHSQYCLGYVSSHAEVDGRWRQILVLTPQRDALRVRHRVGYYAGAAARSAPAVPAVINTP
jgi:Ca-activated chloride channel family protein